MNNISSFAKGIRNINIYAEYNNKLKIVYTDKLGMFIKDGKKVIWLTQEQETEILKMIS
ncbi:hypothetical protein [Clostridium sp.]|uniref:hypothetical protein n=1 Tax=Clostridium sp. TaxID=1506 RepID=UPI001A5D3F7C|nr:hypothetical protein [Clostridium sp.]MBK5239775.1 hypothetical protein [Clostridium sp.]